LILLNHLNIFFANSDVILILFHQEVNLLIDTFVIHYLLDI
jgi:hypothetical protein